MIIPLVRHQSVLTFLGRFIRFQAQMFESIKMFFNSWRLLISSIGTNEQFEEATKKYINIPSYNDSGYILDTGDYIVVKVGNYTPNFYEFLYE